MIRYVITLFISLCSLPTHAFNWQDLWTTPDQQGQHLMAKNQFKEAKETFTRNDWAATAAYRAGDYQKAAELYQTLKNEHDYYNQGNALAHLGQYEKAIKAYDKALTINATNQDAAYNRKLVETLLKQDKENKQNQKQKDKEQQGKEQQNKEQQDKERQDKEKQDKEQQAKEQQDKEQQDKEQQDKEQQDKEQQDKEQQDKEQQDKEQQDKEQQDKEQQDKKQQDKEHTNAASLKAEQEKQRAKEQWLRLIPDDPSGLMREKFLRDHLRRERGWYE